MFQVYRASGKKTYWRFKKKKEKRKREIEEKEKKKEQLCSLIFGIIRSFAVFRLDWPVLGERPF